eukprot:1391511-Amorphochlora_amoeboformis.AAC.2
MQETKCLQGLLECPSLSVLDISQNKLQNEVKPPVSLRRIPPLSNESPANPTLDSRPLRLSPVSLTPLPTTRLLLFQKESRVNRDSYPA